VIEILDNVPMPTQQPAKARAKRRALIVPKPVKNAIERYVRAYTAVYGVPQETSFDGRYVRLQGHNQGVTVGRLREMTKQLRWRVG
jgi:hypothetical protein